MAEQDTAAPVAEPTAEPAAAPTLAELAQQEEDSKATAAAEAAADDKAADGEAADDEGSAEGKASDSGDPDDVKAIVKYFDETHGLKEADKHADDAAFLRSMAELVRLSGRKGDAERLGQQIQERFADDPDALLGFLNGAAPKAGKTADEEFDPSWVTTDEKGQVVPVPGAPADTLERHAALQQRLRKFAANPEKFVLDAVEERVGRIEQANQKTQEETALQRRDAEVNSWFESKKNLVYVEGDFDNGLTRQGQQLVDTYKTIRQRQGEIADPVALLDSLAPLVLAGVPKAPKRSVPGRATRKPGVATQPPPQRDVEKEMRAALESGKSLADVFQAEAEMKAGTGD